MLQQWQRKQNFERQAYISYMPGFVCPNFVQQPMNEAGEFAHLEPSRGRLRCKRL